MASNPMNHNDPEVRTIPQRARNLLVGLTHLGSSHNTALGATVYWRFHPKPETTPNTGVGCWVGCYIKCKRGRKNIKISWSFYQESRTAFVLGVTPVLGVTSVLGGILVLKSNR